MPLDVLSGIVSLNGDFSDVVSAGVVSPQTRRFSARQVLTYTNGTGPGQIDTSYSTPVVLAASMPQTLNLLSFVTTAGTAGSFARVRELYLWIPDSTPRHSVKVGGAATNPYVGLFTGQLLIQPGGSVIRLADCFSTGAGVGAVVTSSSCNLMMDPGANAVTLYLIVEGCSLA